MASSALRTLSVVTLLSAVSGTVIATHHHDDAPANEAAGNSDASLASADLVGVAPSLRVETAGYQARQRSQAEQFQSQFLAQAQAGQRARLQAVLKARHEAKVKAEALAKKAAAARAAHLRHEEALKAEAAAAAAKREKAAAASRAHRVTEQTASRSSAPSGSPQAIAKVLLAKRGWGASQFSCLNSLWNRESGWNVHAQNPSSGAYGIPQALHGSEMASAGPDWRDNAATQITWGLNYIASRYGTPCGAWGHSESTGWY